MSEILIRNTISNINFIIEYNIDINLPSEAEDSIKFLENLINSSKEKESNKYLSEENDQEINNENATKKNSDKNINDNYAENLNSDNDNGIFI